MALNKRSMLQALYNAQNILLIIQIGLQYKRNTSSITVKIVKLTFKWQKHRHGRNCVVLEITTLQIPVVTATAPINCDMVPRLLKAIIFGYACSCYLEIFSSIITTPWKCSFPAKFCTPKLLLPVMWNLANYGEWLMHISFIMPLCDEKFWLCDD